MMLKRLSLTVIIGVCLGAVTWAQETPVEEPQGEPETVTAAPRPRRTGKGKKPAPAASVQDAAAKGKAAKPTTAEAKAAAADEAGVRATFADLVKAIEAADAEAVSKIYWNSPNLVMYNRNGTITKTWEQMKANRTATYATVSEVKLTTRSVNVQMLGRDGAMLSCLWTQSQKNQGQFESSNGRMTLVFRRIKGEWKIVHLHTSPGDGAETK
jgi:uncharacterized protein (TIGR02246 family)